MESRHEAEATEAAGPAREAAGPAGGVPLPAVALTSAAALSGRRGVGPQMRAAAMRALHSGAGNQQVARMVRGAGPVLAREPVAADPPAAEGQQLMADVYKLITDELWPRWAPPWKRPDVEYASDLPKIPPAVDRLLDVLAPSLSGLTSGRVFDAVQKLDFGAVAKAGGGEAAKQAIELGNLMGDTLVLQASEFLATREGRALADKALKRFAGVDHRQLDLMLRKSLAHFMGGTALAWIGNPNWALQIARRFGIAYDRMATELPKLRAQFAGAVAFGQILNIAPDLMQLAGLTDKQGNLFKRHAQLGSAHLTGAVRAEGGGLRLIGAAKAGDTEVSAEGTVAPGKKVDVKATIGGKDASTLIHVHGDDVVISQEALKKVGSASASVKIGAPGADGKPKSLELKISDRPADFLAYSLEAQFDSSVLTRLKGTADAKKGPFDASAKLDLFLSPAERSTLALHFGFSDEKQFAEATADYIRTWGGAGGVTVDELRTHMRFALKRIFFEADMAIRVAKGDVIGGGGTASFGYQDGSWILKGTGGFSAGKGGGDPYLGAEVGVPAPLLPQHSLVFGVRTAPSVPVGGPAEGGVGGSIPAAGAVFTITLVPSGGSRRK